MERSQFMTKLWKLSVMQSRDDILNEMHGVYMHRINELLAQQAKLTAEIQSLFDRHLEEADRYDARIQQQQFSKLARVRKKAASILMRVGPINSQSNVKQLANPMDVKVLQNELTEQNAVSGDKSSTLEGTTLDKVESHSESTDFFDSDSADNHRVKVVKMQSDFVAASPIIQSPTHETDSQRAKPLKYQMLSILPGLVQYSKCTIHYTLRVSY